MDLSGLTGNLYTNTENKANSAAANKLNSTVNGLSANSTDEELMDAIKDFESYFLEKIMKEVKETMTSWGDDDDKDEGMSQLTDMYMDTIYEKMADEMLDSVGGNLTQQLFEQMKRNYSIPIVDSKELP